MTLVGAVASLLRGDTYVYVDEPTTGPAAHRVGA